MCFSCSVHEHKSDLLNLFYLNEILYVEINMRSPVYSPQPSILSSLYVEISFSTQVIRARFDYRSLKSNSSSSWAARECCDWFCSYSPFLLSPFPCGVMKLGSWLVYVCINIVEQTTRSARIAELVSIILLFSVLCCSCINLHSVVIGCDAYRSQIYGPAKAFRTGHK